MLIEIVDVMPLIVAKARSRIVPVVATKVLTTVVIALVALGAVATIEEIAPEHAPVASVQVPAQLCKVIVSPLLPALTVCEIPKDFSCKARTLFTLKYCCQQPLPTIPLLVVMVAVRGFEITIFLGLVALIVEILEPT